MKKRFSAPIVLLLSVLLACSGGVSAAAAEPTDLQNVSDEEVVPSDITGAEENVVYLEADLTNRDTYEEQVAELLSNPEIDEVIVDDVESIFSILHKNICHTKT